MLVAEKHLNTHVLQASCFSQGDDALASRPQPKSAGLTECQSDSSILSAPCPPVIVKTFGVKIEKGDNPLGSYAIVVLCYGTSSIMQRPLAFSLEVVPWLACFTDYFCAFCLARGNFSTRSRPDTSDELKTSAAPSRISLHTGHPQDQGCRISFAHEGKRSTKPN